MAYHYTPEQIEFIVQAYKNHTHTLEELAHYCNTSTQSVRMRLVKLGVYNKLTATPKPKATPKPQPTITSTTTTSTQHNLLAAAPWLQKTKLTKNDFLVAQTWFDNAIQTLGTPIF